MGRFFLPIVAVAGLLVAATCCSRDSDAKPDKPRGPAVGDPAPAFLAPATTGGTLSLGDFAGRIVVLYFYPKDDTPGCIAEAKGFRDAEADMAALGVQVLGVSLDGLDSHRKFVEKHGLNFPLLADTDGRIHDAYGAWKGGIWGRNAMGVDRATFVIDRDGVVRKVWRRVNPSGHGDDVLDFVRTLGGAAEPAGR
jgi:peroxiredoxin Q/BCP